MRVAHVLRKYNPAEWGGTETALHQLAGGLRQHGVDSIVYCPRLKKGGVTVDPLTAAGCRLRRFRARVASWGISRLERDQMIAVGGNLVSFDLLGALWRESGLRVVHTHALGRIGGAALTIARLRRIPSVVTVHGGVYDLPEELRRSLNAPTGRGLEWGKLYGWVVRSRQVLEDADAILTCNPREAELIRERHPEKKVVVQPHGVPAELYRRDHRDKARIAFPGLWDRPVLVCLGRIDPVKNQLWLVERMAEVHRRDPEIQLVLVGAETDPAYADAVRQRIAELDLAGRVLMPGRLPPSDPRLIGLLQLARAVLVPSLSETFGLVILEAWAAGAPVISSRTSGAAALIEHGKSGWLFEHGRPQEFDDALETVLRRSAAREAVIAEGRRKVAAHYDVGILAGRVKQLYEQLIDEKDAIRRRP